MDRQGFNRFGLSILTVLILCVFTNAQNLVPNPSFEDFEDCPFLAGQISEAYGWYNALGSCDYYHECGNNGFGIPINKGGGGQARTGMAYGQLATWSRLIENGREYVGIELIEQLQTNVDYRIDFYISLQDSLNHAVRNIGAHFSGLPHQPGLSAFLALTPQVQYEDTAFLDEKLGWMRVSGTFTASGGERYLAIGNFDNDSNTDTISVPSGGSLVNHPEGFWDVAGYFIDDVSVIPDSIYLDAGSVEMEERELTLYPNPNTGEFSIELSLEDDETAVIHVWSSSGQEVYNASLNDGVNQLEIRRTSGLYLYSVVVNGIPEWAGKVSIGLD